MWWVPPKNGGSRAARRTARMVPRCTWWRRAPNRWERSPWARRARGTPCAPSVARSSPSRARAAPDSGCLPALMTLPRIWGSSPDRPRRPPFAHVAGGKRWGALRTRNCTSYCLGHTHSTRGSRFGPLGRSPLRFCLVCLHIDHWRCGFPSVSGGLQTRRAQRTPSRLWASHWRPRHSESRSASIRSPQRSHGTRPECPARSGRTTAPATACGSPMTRPPAYSHRRRCRWRSRAACCHRSRCTSSAPRRCARARARSSCTRTAVGTWWRRARAHWSCSRWAAAATADTVRQWTRTASETSASATSVRCRRTRCAFFCWRWRAS